MPQGSGTSLRINENVENPRELMKQSNSYGVSQKAEKLDRP